MRAKALRQAASGLRNCDRSSWLGRGEHLGVSRQGRQGRQGSGLGLAGTDLEFHYKSDRTSLEEALSGSE